MTFDEALIFFKNSDKEIRETVLLIVDDIELQKAVVAWRNCNTQLNKDKWENPPTGSSNDELWNALWKCAEVSIAQFRVAANLPTMRTEPVFRTLKMNHLIYPDGSINPVAWDYIGKVLDEKLGGVGSKKRGRPKKDK